MAPPLFGRHPFGALGHWSHGFLHEHLSAARQTQAVFSPFPQRGSRHHRTIDLAGGRSLHGGPGLQVLTDPQV